MLDDKAFDIWEGKQPWHVSLLEFMRERNIADLGLVGSFVSLAVIAWQVMKYADKLTLLSAATIAFVALLVASIGLVSLLKGTKHGTTTETVAGKSVESGNVGGCKKETRKSS